jgi:hypothetical protein
MQCHPCNPCNFHHRVLLMVTYICRKPFTYMPPLPLRRSCSRQKPEQSKATNSRHLRQACHKPSLVGGERSCHAKHQCHMQCDQADHRNLHAMSCTVASCCLHCLRMWSDQLRATPTLIN